MIYRIDVRTAAPARGGEAAGDPLGQAVRQQIAELGADVGPVQASRIFLIDTDADEPAARRIADELLADPIVESAELMLHPPADNGRSRIEIHLKPGVMDPVAASAQMAIRDMGLEVREVRTGRAYLIDGRVGRDQLDQIASRVLANGVIESIHFEPFIPKQFERGHEYRFHLKHIRLRELTDDQLVRLSREGHLFLSLAEMKAIQDYFRGQDREPTNIELETLAQTWSEHCVHKTFKSAVDLEVQDESGKVVARRHYENLIRDTIFESTMQLMGRSTGVSPVRAAGHGRDAHATADPFCLSVFKDNAGVIAFDETDAVCFKVETHNHPSAIEPYGGSATGVGGVIRDVLGTGLGARPVANTDVFCVAYPGSGPEGTGFGVQGAAPSSLTPNPLPKGVIHPKRILQQVVSGVRDYGNRMGIPTVNGAVYFDDRYIGNPLVFCGCVGLIPRDKVEKAARGGDAIVLMGGRTGRDGIHGATFSSAELTDTHAAEFSHAVQIGNPITQKKMADVILQARDRGLFSAITDCGAGGLSSAVGEMGEKTGAAVDLEKVPLKYAGLRYDEIWISEAQERMVLSVPQEKVDELLELSAGEDVEATVIGRFGAANQELILSYKGTEVGRMSMQFIHAGIPMPRRKAVVVQSARGTGFQPVQASLEDGRSAQPGNIQHGLKTRATAGVADALLALLAHPNIASKHWIIRQYDHEVQGGSVIKPLIGPEQIGPSDAAVIRPKLSSMRGLAIGCGLVPYIADPYEMAIASIDEAVRNVVAVGADPGRIAILDNFCWPSVDDERTMGTLVRACEACRDAALAYGIPFISGKDSLHNQFTNQETGEVIRIPNTLLISAVGVIEDVRRCVTMDLKQAGNTLFLVRPAMGREQDLNDLAALHRGIAAMIAREMIAACHDVSDGGVVVAAAEMCIASGLGLMLATDLPAEELFREVPGRYLIEVPNPDALEAVTNTPDFTAELVRLGSVTDRPRLEIHTTDGDESSVEIEQMRSAWRGTLDW